MPQQSINALDRRVQSINNDSINNTIQASTEQNILVTDIISEGEIEGLVNGSRSVFLNNDPIDDNNDQVYSNSSTKVAIAAASTNATISLNGEVFKTDAEGSKFLLIHKIATVKVTISGHSPYIPGGEVPGGSWDGVPELATFTRASGDSFATVFNMPSAASKVITDGKTIVQLKLASGEIINQGTISGINVSNQTAAWSSGSMKNSMTSTDTNGSTQHELIISRFFKIQTIAGNTITLATAPGATGTFSFTITKDTLATVNALGQRAVTQKYKDSEVAFSKGTLDQEALSTLEGTGTSSVSLNISNPSLEKFSTSNYTTITATGAQAAQIDEVKLIMQYPSGCYLTSVSSGSKYLAGVAYHIELAVHTGGTLVYNTVAPPVSGNNVSAVFDSNGDGTHDTACWGVVFKKTAKFATEFRINLEGLQPFNGFTIRISRITKHDPEDYTIEHRFAGTENTSSSSNRAGGIGSTFESEKGNAARAANNGVDGKHLAGTYTSSLVQAIGLIKEKLSFPYTAFANTSFSSKTFQSQPTRGYECEGLKVKIPSNYVTRKETGNLSAKYTRTSEDGDVGTMNTPQLWDGSFRPNLVYTDNPAWVFYDICTNNRYGLGDYLLETDIDKFSLYKVAKYCDELVPDGKGGTEPRFRSNIYITKATDAYKILKDFATVFRGILFWSDSQFSAILDEPKEPIYTFTRANVIDGNFEYQSTGSKTRANQMIVSWNNPEAEYKLETIIVEDRENQIKTGTVKSEKAVAFGCTSEGQAIRYGRWKLWTAINQTEIVSFKTGINAAFLGPGDIINLQDESDFRVPFSGRVHSCTNTNITIDREISDHLTASFTYTIAVIIPKKTVLLNQESATLANAAGGTTTFSRGDEVISATIGGATTTILHATDDTTQRNIVSAVDTSNRPVNLQLVEETIVEEQLLNISSKSTSEGRDTIALATPFSVTPGNGDVWAIKQTNALGTPTVNSYKQYKILGIGESGPTEFDITAVEHYNTKFDLVDRDFTLAVPDPLYPREDTLIDVPPPINLRVLRTPIDTSPGEELVIEWDSPLPEGASGAFSEYEHLGEYKVEHTFGMPELGIFGMGGLVAVPNGLVSGSRVHRDSRSHTFIQVENGYHTVRVTTISTKGRHSVPAEFNIKIDDIFEEVGKNWRLGGILKGAASTVDLAAPVNDGSTKGLVSFANSSYIIAPFGRLQGAKTNTVADADSYSLSCTALASSSWPADASAYLMLDFSAVDVAAPNANALKLIVRKIDTTTYGSRIDYWYDAIKYIASAASIWTSAGNVSVTNGTSKVVGSGFLNLKIPDVVTIGSAFAGKIALIVSDTVMYLDRPWTAASATGQALKKQELDIDYDEDFLVAPVSYDSTGAGTYTLGGTRSTMTWLDITPDLTTDPRSIVASSDTSIIKYNSSDTQTTTYSNITLAIDTLGFQEAEVNVTGAGFSQTNQTADSSTSYTTTTNGALSKVLHNSNANISFSTTPLVFTIRAREKLDPDNTAKQRTITYTITKLKDGSIGLDGKTVVLTSDDYSIIYDEDYTNPLYNSSGSNNIVITATANNFTDPLYRFTFAGSAGSWTDTSGTSAATYTFASGSIPSVYTKSQWPKVVKIEAGEKPAGWSSGAPDTITATDSISLIGVAAGVGGVAIVNSNSAHTYNTPSTGLATGISIPATTLELIVGGVVYAYIGGTSGYNNPTGTLDNKEWYIGTPTVTGSDLTIGAPSSVTANVVTISNHTGQSGTDNDEIVTWPIIYKQAGITHTIKTTQTLSKSIAGGIGGAGVTGAGTNFVFKRAATKPNVPTANGLAIPSGWSDAPPTGTDLLWSSKGTVAAGGTAYAWGAVFQVEGTAVSEIRIYSDVVANNGASPSVPTGSTFNFASSTLTINDSNWNKEPPSVTADGHTVYSCTALVSGSPADTSVAVSWSVSTIFARKTDGVTGAGTNFVFARQTAKPPTPTANGLNIPSASIQWYDSPPATPLETLWSSKGVVAAGGTAYVWGAVFQVEGSAVAELRCYSDVVANNGNSPTKPSGSIYNATTSTLILNDSNWNLAPPSVLNSGDTVYSCTTLVTGASTATAIAIGSGWSTPTIHTRKTDGAPGVDGVALTLTASPVLFTFDGTYYDPTPNGVSTLTLAASGGTITGVAWTTSSGTLGSTTGNSSNTLTFAANRTEAQVKASATVTAVVTGTDSGGNTGQSFGTITAKIATSLQGLDGSPGGPGFFFIKRADTGTSTAPTNGTQLGHPDSGEISNASAGNIAIIENTPSSGTPTQAAWKYTTAWVLVTDFFRAEVIAAGAIGAQQLAISNNTSSGAGIYMDATSNRIEIRDSTTNNPIRIKIGNLS
jgi:hypothetical protein